MKVSTVKMQPEVREYVLCHDVIRLGLTVRADDGCGQHCVQCCVDRPQEVSVQPGGGRPEVRGSGHANRLPIKLTGCAPEMSTQREAFPPRKGTIVH